MLAAGIWSRRRWEIDGRTPGIIAPRQLWLTAAKACQTCHPGPQTYRGCHCGAITTGGSLDQMI